MRLGDKIKYARQQAGLSQVQLAQKLFVSRAAVAKWETGKGMPDIQNLKALANALNVTTDYLLDEDETPECGVIRESIVLEDVPETDRRLDKYDAIVISRYPDAYWIHRAALQYDLNTGERVVNGLTFGLFACIWRLCHWRQHAGGHYYLVELGDRQCLVQVENNLMTSTTLSNRIHNVDAFDVGTRRFIRLPEDLLKQK